MTKAETMAFNAKAMGFKVSEYTTRFGDILTLVKKPNNDCLLCIPSNVVSLFDFSSLRVEEGMNYYHLIKQVECNTMKIIGGESLIRLDNLFSFCTIDNFDFSEFKTPGLIDMRALFDNCIIRNTNFNGLDTSKVEYMNSMFNECELVNGNLSTLNTSSVKNMAGMFSGCSASTLDLSSFDTHNVKEMSLMFYKCNIYKELNLSNFNTSSLKNNYDMFESSHIENLICDNDKIKKIYLKSKKPKKFNLW